MDNIIENLNTPFKIVVVDDDQAITETINVFLEEEKNIDYRITNDGKKALDYIRKLKPHAVLTDMKMPLITGLEILKKTKKINPNIEVILMTAYASAQSAVEAMKEGAYDYIIKPFKIIELKSILEKIVKTQELEKQNEKLKEKLKQYESDKELIGISESMKKIKNLIKIIADNNTSVLITGESGTGKSLLAENIHLRSNRKNNPFVTIECASIPENLLESELFGYEQGAFTGAEKKKIGRLENANNGTLFLDEIGDMPLNLQAKMLRVLQERELVRVGGSKNIPINVRIIAATNKDLSQMVQTGQFREDLYYRLNVLPIDIPPLRDRKEDIPILVNSILKKLTNNESQKILSSHVLEQINNYDWPGNIRELENILERTIIMEKSDTINSLFIQEIPNINDKYLNIDTFEKMQLSKDGINLQKIEKILLKKAISMTKGNLEQAAQLLKIDITKFKKIKNNG